MNRANLQLSEEERRLISNVDWILTKNRLLNQVRDLLSELQQQQSSWLSQVREYLPPEVISIPPKISRGENYEGLPWLMLDLPRFFQTDDQMAIRSFFWWGHGFSVTLQLRGRYQQQFEASLRHAYPKLSVAGWQAGIHSDPWQHHFRADNYQDLADLGTSGWNSYISSHPFVKLTKRVSIEHWETAPIRMGEHYQLLLEILAERTVNCQGGGKDPSPGDPTTGFGL